MRGSAVVHVENNYGGIVAHTSDVIALLPVAQKAATEPEITYPGSASLMPRTAYPDFSPGLEDTSQDSLAYLHHQYIRVSRHKSGSAGRSLRNLACRRARQSDVISQRNVNCVLGEQYITGDSKTTVGSGPLQPLEPTVRVERLEVEVHRYGRIVPTSNGSYHVLDTSGLESSLHVSAGSFRVDSEVARAHTEMDRVSGAVESVSDDAIDCGYCVKGSDSANDCSQNEKNSSRKYQNEHNFKNSTHESRSWERDLTTDAGICRNSSACLENISTDRQSFQKDAWKGWQPVYENISDPDSDPDSIKGTKPSEKRKGEMVSTKHINLDCAGTKNSETRSRHSDVRKHKAVVSVKKRRHSAAEDSERKRKKKEKQKKRHRRWSFNTESDMPQTDHIKTMKKPYLSRLVLWKDAKIKSWNVVIDLARDEQTIEEFKVPVLPILKNMALKEKNVNTENKEAATAITEETSSGITQYAKEPRPSNKQTKSGDYSSSELNQEINIEDEDTIEAPRGFFSVLKDDVNNTCYSRSVKEERSSLPNETVSGLKDRMPVPQSAPSNSVITSALGFRNETGRISEIPSETPESQTNEAGLVAKSLITKPKDDNTVPTKVILSADKSNLKALKVTDCLERCSVDTSIVAKIERDKGVTDVPCNSANSVQTDEYSSPEMHNQDTDVASKKIRESRELSENLGSDACGNKFSGMGRRKSYHEGPSGTTSDDAARKVNFSNRTVDSLLANSEKLNGVGINCAATENSVSSNNAGCSRNFEERDYPGHKIDDRILETGKESISRNFEKNPSVVSVKMPSQQDVTGEENISKRIFENSNVSYSSRSHNPINFGQVSENDNYSSDTDKELAIDENRVDIITDQEHIKHDADTQIDSENTTEDMKMARETHELINGSRGRGSSPSKMTKKKSLKLRIITMHRQQLQAKKEASSDNYKTHKKPHGLRKPRYSRRRFRHDSIQMFKVSTALPPHTTPVPWRYKCKKPELPDPIDTQDINIPSPVLNSSSTQSRFDGNVTNIEIDDDIPSPGSLTIDLGEQNTDTPETSNTGEDERSRKKCNSDASGGEEEAVSLPRRRRKSSEGDSVRMKEKATLSASTENDQEHPQSGDPDSETSDEGQRKTKRKRMKKRKSGDFTVTSDVKQHIFMAKMQEKGRRLAQELPGFNWLEEKILNGGVTAVLTPRRLSGATCSRSNGGSSVDTSSIDMRAVPTSEGATVIPNRHVSNSALDAARSTSPTEYRHSKRLQEYLSRPPKRAKQVSPVVASELENQIQAVASLRSTHEHAEAPPLPLTPAPMPSVQRLHYPQLKSPRQIQTSHTVPEREHSPHRQQSSRRPVIVSASELSKRSDVSPLLQQLTSGGELEVTLSTPPTSSSASSDSGVGSSSSHRTSSDAEQTEVTHVSVKPVHARKGQQNAEERPRDATPCRRISYGVEQLSQPHQPEPSSFLLHERIPVHVWNREQPQWQGVSDVPATKVHESTTGNPETVPPLSPYGNPDRTYSDRIATMARHAATSFDTGFGIGLGASQEAGHQVPRHIPHRPSDSTHPQTSYQREQMLKTSGYMPPLLQQPGIFYSRLPQHGLYHPSYMVQQPIKPHVVRPSAQYPAGVGPYCPPPAYLQTVTAVSNSQDLISGIPQYSNSLNSSQPSMFSSHASQRLRDPSTLATNSAVPSTSSTSVQEVASVAQVSSLAQNQTQISGLQHQAMASDRQIHAQDSGPENQAETSVYQNQAQTADHQNQVQTLDHQNQTQTSDVESQEKTSDCQNQVQASDHQNEAQTSDFMTKDNNSPKDLEEIRKAAEAAAEELEKLEQLKQTTKKDLQRLKLAHEQAMEELARTQEQLVKAVGVHKVGQTVQTRPAVPSATAAATRSSLPELHVTLPAVAHERHQSPVVQDNHHSAQRSSNAADVNGHSIPELHTTLPSFTQENCQSTVASENHQSGVAHENQQSTVALEDHQLGVTCENKTQQESSITSDSSASSISGFNIKFPAVAQVNQPTEVACKNQQSEVACGSRETQEKQSVSSDSTRSSVPRSNTTFSKVAWENQQLQVGHENHQTQQKPNGTSDSIGSVTPELHATVPKVAHENHLTQQKSSVSSHSTGSLPGLNIKFPAVAYENQQSEVARENQQSEAACRNHKTQQTPSVTSDNTGSSIAGLNITFPAVVPVNQKSGVACENKQSGTEHKTLQSDIVDRNHKSQQKLSVTSDSTGRSMPGLNTFPAGVPVKLQSGVARENQQSEIACRNHKTQQELSVTSDSRHTGSSMPVLNMIYPKVTCENHQSEETSNSTVSTVKNSVPTLLTPCPTTAHQNQEPVQRPPPPPLLSRSQPPVPISISQRPSPFQTLLMSHQISHSQSRPVSHLQTHSVVLPPHPAPTLQRQHSQPASAVHQPLRPLHPKPFPGSRPSVHLQLYASQPPLHPHLSPVSQTSLQSQSETSPHFQSLPMSQTFPQSQSLPMSRRPPYSQLSPVSQISPNSHSLPVSQISPHSQLSPVSQASQYSQLSPMSQMSRSQPGSLTQPPLHRQPLQVPQHSPSGNQPLQLSTDQLRSTANIPQSSLEILETQNKPMPPPPLRQRHVLPKPPRLSGSQIPISVHSNCTSLQPAPATITAHSKQSPSYASVIPQGSSTQQPFTVTQEPPVLSHTAIISPSTSNRLPNSTVEEYPMDLSISKQKSPSKDKIKPPVSVSSTVLPLCQHNEQSSNSSRHHQDRSQNQPSVLHHPNLEKHNAANHSGILYHDHRMPQSHISQHISTENSRLEQQLPTSAQTCNKRMIPSNHVASISTVNFATVNDGSGRRPNIHPTSPGSSDRYKHLETQLDQNIDNGSVLQRQHVHVPTHHDMVHYRQHPVQTVHQYHSHRPTPSSSYIPVYHEAVLHGHKSEQQQQRNHTAEPHTASTVASERDRYCSANRRISHTAALTPAQSSQDARSVEGQHYKPHSQLVCGRCNQTASFMCSACHNEWYCSSDCQLRHWTYHSSDCRRQQQNEHK